MNITDVMRFKPRTVLASETALSLLAPAAATGLLVSISDVIQGRKPVRQTIVLNSALSKIKTAVKQANRDGMDPKIALSEEEGGALEMALHMAKSGVGAAAEIIGDALFSFVPWAIEMIVVPMVTAVSWTVMTVLPLLLTPEGLIAAGLTAGGYLLYRKWREWRADQFRGSDRGLPQSGPIVIPGSTAKEVSISEKAPSSIRNNNPGNLVYAAQPGAAKGTGRFATFSSQGVGLYNIGRQIELYRSRGITTVRGIVSTYAPHSENDTAAYISDVCTRMGVKPDTVLDLSKSDVLASLMKAIVMHESGANPYSDQQFLEAAEQALAFARNGYKDQAAAAPGPVVKGSLVMPASGIVSSPFGHRGFVTEGATTEHKGVDIAGAYGSPIVAATDGTVEKAGAARGYGNLIQIRGSDLITRYGHLSSVGVKVGDQVSAGQIIGKMGNEGVSTGTHLHFETQPVTGPEPVDPSAYFPELNKGTRVASGTAGVVAPKSTPYQPPELVSRDGRLIGMNT